jgi:hypothetical protein
LLFLVILSIFVKHMATLNEIAYNIKRLAYGGKSNSEQNVNIEQIKFWIHYHRAMMLKEISAEGKELNYSNFQSILFDQSNDAFAIRGQWENYINTTANDTIITEAIEDDPATGEDETAAAVTADPTATTNSSNQLIAYSNRTASLAGITPNSQLTRNESFYGSNHYYNNFKRRHDDYGIFVLNMPNVINIDGSGIKNLRYRKTQDNLYQNHGSVDIPILSRNEWENKQYNRFSKHSVSAFVSRPRSNNNIDQLNIGYVKSVFKSDTNGYEDPIRYLIYADLLLSDPTKMSGWNDDQTYPLQQSLVNVLIERILQKELNFTLRVPTDTISDNSDTTKIVQPQVQRQVRNS